MLIEVEDRLSELPLPLILLILSFLPMKDVVKTTILSKSWQNLWTCVPCLNFCNLGLEKERARSFIKRALMSWNGIELSKFEFDFTTDFDTELGADIASWVSFAVEHKVKELSIHLVYLEQMCYVVPPCLNTCSSLRKLTLVGIKPDQDVDPTWNQLERLKLHGFCFEERFVNGILSGSPRLEVFELCLLDTYENLNIRSTSLKSLKIGKYLYSWFTQASRDKVLTICCPNLKTLEVSRVPYVECLFTDVSSLTDATLGFYDVADDFIHLFMDRLAKKLLGETIIQILPTIRHVEKLALSAPSVEVLCALQRKRLLAPFPNVKILEVTVKYNEVGFDVEYSDVINLLGSFPELNTLVIKDQTLSISGPPPQFNTLNYAQFEANLSKYSLLQLKTIRITSTLCSNSMFQTIVFLLREAVSLEKFAIWTVPAKSFTPSFPFKVAKRLRNLPRSSPTARVMVIPKW